MAPRRPGDSLANLPAISSALVRTAAAGGPTASQASLNLFSRLMVSPGYCTGEGMEIDALPPGMESLAVPRSGAAGSSRPYPRRGGATLSGSGSNAAAAVAAARRIGITMVAVPSSSATAGPAPSGSGAANGKPVSAAAGAAVSVPSSPVVQPAPLASGSPALNALASKRDTTDAQRTPQPRSEPPSPASTPTSAAAASAPSIMPDAPLLPPPALSASVTAESAAAPAAGGQSQGTGAPELRGLQRAGSGDEKSSERPTVEAAANPSLRTLADVNARIMSAFGGAPDLFTASFAQPLQPNAKRKEEGAGGRAPRRAARARRAPTACGTPVGGVESAGSGAAQDANATMETLSNVMLATLGLCAEKCPCAECRCFAAMFPSLPQLVSAMPSWLRTPLEQSLPLNTLQLRPGQAADTGTCKCAVCTYLEAAGM